ncbi:hypothetical protein LGR54_04445 [Ancylobacter sp. Lp-2]|uniref:hypothetical protein n=1 Tax=Ancylobacter sp. Lp-2 TaxID=2881339 RepID=UPI001E37E7C0|nr:hypothetical protein [Ancylobacter sp. Lp-2]MCB4767844.1 hypothetical protein [Ancylobacter sp. Lp-2]
MELGSNGPCRYFGLHFESRLHATWAAFFDHLGWHYEYRPFGPRGWAPTFSLIGASTVLVGVEPELKPTPAARLLASGSSRVAGHRGDILLLGTGLGSIRAGGIALGAIAEWCGGDYGWGDAVPHVGGGIGFCHDSLSYRNRMTGFHDGDRGAGDGEERFVEAWRAARRAALIADRAADGRVRRPPW